MQPTVTPANLGSSQCVTMELGVRCLAFFLWHRVLAVWILSFMCLNTL